MNRNHQLNRNTKQWVYALLFLAFAGSLFLAASYASSTPGVSFPTTELGTGTRQAEQLRRHVDALTEIGERRAKVKSKLDQAREYLWGELRGMGYPVVEHTFQVDNLTFTNLEVVVEGGSLAHEIVVVGAHYDTYRRSPGADDNASGCAVLLELARELKNEADPRTLRLVFFALSEWPQLHTDDMGSRHWIHDAQAAGDDVVAMLSLDSLGVYSDVPGSQSYPPILNFFYPDTGDFVGFLGNLSSRDLMQTSVRLFREARRMPAEGLVVPGWAPSASASDHASFWREGIPAVLVTDTMGWRNPNHHDPLDLQDGLDFERMVLVVDGLTEVCRGLRRGASL